MRHKLLLLALAILSLTACGKKNSTNNELNTTSVANTETTVNIETEPETTPYESHEVEAESIVFETSPNPNQNLIDWNTLQYGEQKQGFIKLSNGDKSIAIGQSKRAEVINFLGLEESAGESSTENSNGANFDYWRYKINSLDFITIISTPEEKGGKVTDLYINYSNNPDSINIIGLSKETSMYDLINLFGNPTYVNMAIYGYQIAEWSGTVTNNGKELNTKIKASIEENTQKIISIDFNSDTKYTSYYTEG